MSEEKEPAFIGGVRIPKRIPHPLDDYKKTVPDWFTAGRSTHYVRKVVADMRKAFIYARRRHRNLITLGMHREGMLRLEAKMLKKLEAKDRRLDGFRATIKKRTLTVSYLRGVIKRKNQLIEELRKRPTKAELVRRGAKRTEAYNRKVKEKRAWQKKYYQSQTTIKNLRDRYAKLKKQKTPSYYRPSSKKEKLSKEEQRFRDLFTKAPKTERIDIAKVHALTASFCKKKKISINYFPILPKLLVESKTGSLRKELEELIPSSGVDYFKRKGITNSVRVGGGARIYLTVVGEKLVKDYYKYLEENSCWHGTT